MDEHEPAVMRQTTVTLPFLDDEVPALYLEDGRPYIRHHAENCVETMRK